MTVCDKCGVRTSASDYVHCHCHDVGKRLFAELCKNCQDEYHRLEDAMRKRQDDEAVALIRSFQAK